MSSSLTQQRNYNYSLPQGRSSTRYKRNLTLPANNVSSQSNNTRTNDYHSHTDTYLTTNEITFSSNFFNRNHIKRWFFHNPINFNHDPTQTDDSSTSTSAIIRFSPVPPHPFEPYHQNNRIWKREVILCGKAMPLPGMEQELLLAGKIRMVMEMQSPGFYWTEQICRQETSGSGILRIAQLTLWESGHDADAFRFSKDAAEWRSKNMDMIIPGSYDGTFYRILHNPHYQKLTHASHLLKEQQQQRQITTSSSSSENKQDNDKSSNHKYNLLSNNKQEATSTNEKKSHDWSATFKKTNNKAGCIINNTSSSSSSSSSSRIKNCFTVLQEPAYAVFIDVCPKREKTITTTKTQKEVSGTTKIKHKELRKQKNLNTINLFMSLLFTSEVCAVYEKGCLRYMILLKSREPQQQQQDRQQLQQPLFSKNNSNQTIYTIYAVFTNKEAFQFHSKQGYSVLSERFKELCAPLFPTITDYTRNTI